MFKTALLTSNASFTGVNSKPLTLNWKLPFCGHN